MQVKSAPEIAEQKAGLPGQEPLARISLGNLLEQLKRKVSPPPKSAADLGFLKKDLGRLGSFLGGGEAKAAELQVSLQSLFFSPAVHRIDQLSYDYGSLRM